MIFGRPVAQFQTALEICVFIYVATFNITLEHSWESQGM
jgi:hypothetical protein